ncbi:phage tail protein [Serratia nevei]|uniref:phage tail-collar fiber domain-containing protein n=1 Tax=Serratia TaxID=613 RepID=UPI002200B2BC|nr:MULTISPECIES: phage tail protein [Serratia]WIJ66837.1 phage tail protein [Serratia nevei]CAI1740528.1 Phage tail fibre repeat [Serratia marcescens]CAI1813342.1 Phage tail fibre repeat [Serratia marcescens]CAI1905625.1 Phage tail fibre repeat [Serratia marcescens]CAI1925218.1 Phage tail fibre repeat [Serratia marcescens]
MNMSKYKAIVTTAGAAKIAAASAGGKQLKITHMAVGDGNGVLPTPNPAQTKLINEKYRALLNTLTIDKSIDNHIIAEFIIPANVGGFWLREMGLYDDAGVLIAASNMAESYKPKLEEGSGRTQTLRMVLIVSSTDAIQIIAGGDTVLATRDFVDDAIKAHEKTRNHPDASTTAKGLVQLSSATTSNDETKAATPKAVKDVNDASAKKAANLSDLADKAAARGNLALGTAATKNVGTEGGNVMAVGAFGLGGEGTGYAMTSDAELMAALKARGSCFFRNTKDVTMVPTWGPGIFTRAGDANGLFAINPFNGSVTAAGFTDTNLTSPKINVLYGTANKPTAADVGALTDAQAAQKYALRSIKVNGKPLSGDVNLLAGDVNAWNKTEADGRFVKRVGDTMTGALALPRVIFPSEGMQDLNADDDITRPDGFTLEQLGDKSVGYPLTKGNLGNLMTFKLNKYRHVQFAIGSGNTEFWLRSPREDNPNTSKKWAQVYTTDYKPTIGDVGAADQSNNFAARMGTSRVLAGNSAPTSPGVWSVENSSWAAVPWGSVLCTTNGSDLSTAPGNGKFQHYLQLAHEAGGKPGLRAAVNVNGTFSGWDSVMMSRGGTFNGVVKTNAEIQSTSSDNYRLIGGDYGSFWRNDGNALYLMLTNAKDQYGTWNSLRPFTVDVKTGQVTFAHAVGMNNNLTVNGNIRGDKNVSIGEDLWVDRNATVAGSLKVGASTHSGDGNIMGSRWGNKWLWDAIVEQDNGRVDWGTFNREVGARATTDYVNSRSNVAGGRDAWWYKDEVTGLIFQGGTVTRGGDVTWVGFPRGYQRECFGVQMTLFHRWGTSQANIEARDAQNGGFNAVMFEQEHQAYWWAVGV